MCFSEARSYFVSGDCEVRLIDAPVLPPMPVRGVDDAAKATPVRGVDAAKATDELCFVCKCPSRQMVKCTWDEMVSALYVDIARASVDPSSCQNMLHEDCAMSCLVDDNALKFCQIHHHYLRGMPAGSSFGERELKMKLYRSTQAALVYCTPSTPHLRLKVRGLMLTWEALPFPDTPP